MFNLSYINNIVKKIKISNNIYKTKKLFLFKLIIYNMKSLNRYIREQRTLDVSELITEGRIKNMSDIEWLNSLYGLGSNSWLSGNSGVYIQNIYDNVQTHALYGISRDSVNDWKEKLSKNKGIGRFRKVNANSKYYAILCFKYDPEKDEERKEAISGEAEQEKKAAEKFANDVKNADTSKYKTDDKHIKKMKDYFNKRSDPERLVKSIKDDNKLVARWIAAIKMGWEEAISVFGRAITDKKLLTKAEIIAYTEKYKADDEKVDDSDMNRLDKETKKIAESWITKSLYKYFESLKDYTIEWKEAFKNAKTIEGREVMKRNGRAWTEGFIVTVTKGDKSIDVTFDVVTNEGGGLYGYVLQYGIVNLKQFKTQFSSLLKKKLYD